MPYSRQLWRRLDGWIFRGNVDAYITRTRASGYRTQTVYRATRAPGYAHRLIDHHYDGNDVFRKTVFSSLSYRRKIGKLQNGEGNRFKPGDELLAILNAL
ncbi:hypothetical protein T8J41_19540 (plasmid) [Nitratireductor rhodophyticola]|uniref:Uncharacterized protein n=1 Tax=Nitratireductor rhodophyticola TaxID=2854036 RepID=A0ABS7REW7_9HYPH|nr:hypothetical protein [Nitratireductor rhodophyticola]MBY8918952.1 hypothetical protein [Nitratireductor rhodophyticola]MBY8922993.1 hypothetical protein [Nitratireductor rhodophyticola]MEC9246129.1 hypothetical protein [Pseudomonadota bacterium]WPZ16390.1 hypothetical protein T8J41_19540 [Nitratireductor rhodophyticola]